MTCRKTTVGLVLAMAITWGCSDSTIPADAPDGHTVNEDGVAHLPGHESPETHCVACHGADLRGGAAAEPSCYSCHGREW